MSKADYLERGERGGRVWRMNKLKDAIDRIERSKRSAVRNRYDTPRETASKGY